MIRPGQKIDVILIESLRECLELLRFDQLEDYQGLKAYDVIKEVDSIISSLVE